MYTDDSLYAYSPVTGPGVLGEEILGNTTIIKKKVD